VQAHEQRESVTRTTSAAVKVTAAVPVVEYIAISAAVYRARAWDALLLAADDTEAQELTADAQLRQYSGPVNAGVNIVGAKVCGDGAHAALRFA
jgi:hypothetical protein